MVFMIAGVLLVVLKLLGAAGFGAVGWAWVLSPFVAALLWWRLADALGWTARWSAKLDRERRERRRQRYSQHLLEDPALRRRSAAIAMPARRGAWLRGRPPVSRTGRRLDV